MKKETNQTLGEKREKDKHVAKKEKDKHLVKKEKKTNTW